MGEIIIVIIIITIIIIISNINNTITTVYVILIIVPWKDCCQILGQVADDGMNTLLSVFDTRDLLHNTAGIKCYTSNGKIISY
jgi:hypothetical protein